MRAARMFPLPVAFALVLSMCAAAIYLTAGRHVPFLRLVEASAAQDHRFGSASFTKVIWIENRTVFEKPVGVDVEFVTSGAFDWVFADSTGKEVRTLRHENAHGGWTSVDFDSLGLFGNYMIGFRNASAGQQTIKQGLVRLK